LSAPVTVGQALHGYEDGHRLLASSAKLDRESESGMRELSDLVSGRTPGAEGNYISGYPLPRARMYVIAATWAAQEVPRPGAAWTHSLLIPYDDIPKIGNAVGLAALFRRPYPGSDRRSYSQPLQWRDWPNGEGTSRPAPWAPAATVLKALYSSDEPVAVHLDSIGMKGSQDGVLAIWSQQWPSLRRAFRFRTSGRSGTGATFDLTLVSTRQARLDLEHAPGRSGDTDRPEWLRLLRSDLDRRSPPLHRFLARYGLDAAAPRTAFPLLANCWLWLRGRSNDEGWLEALAARRGGDLAKLRSDAASLALAGQDVSPERAAELLWAAARLWPEFPAPGPDRPFVVRQATAVEERLEALFDNAAGRGKGTLATYALGVAARACGPSAVLRAVGSKLDRLEAVATSVPGLLGEEQAWARPAILEWLLRNGPVAPGDEARVISLTLRGSPALAEAVLARFGLAAVRQWVATVAGRPSLIAIDDPWLLAVLARPEDFLEALSSGPPLGAALLDRLVRAYSDRWPGLPRRTDAWSEASKNLDLEEVAVWPDLRAFLFSCGLHAESPDAEALLERTFESMHDELAAEPMPILGLLSFLQLPWGAEWDRCRGLRNSVARAFVENDLDPRALKRIARDCGTLRQLYSAIEDTPGGRLYLRDRMGERGG